MSATPIVLFDCVASGAIAPGADITITERVDGTYTVRAAVGEDLVDGAAIGGASSGDMLTIVGGPDFGQRPLG